MQPPEPRGKASVSPETVLGFTIAALGGVMLLRSWIGLPVLMAGIWFATGRGIREFREGLSKGRKTALGWALGLFFFGAAIVQAAFALAPILPLFAISALLLPPVREACHALTQRVLPSLLREALIAALLCAYAALVAQDLAVKAEQERQVLFRGR